MIPDQLAAATGAPRPRAQMWLDAIEAAMGAFAITTPARQAAFLATIGHESGRLLYVCEIWGATPAQLRYEGRKDLGNLRPGDGRRFMGRGLIQTTGRANYVATRDGLREHLPSVPDFEASPMLLELPRWAAYSAGWFWSAHGCNELADAGSFLTISIRVNGHNKDSGLPNGWEDRVALWESGKNALRATA